MALPAAGLLYARRPSVEIALYGLGLVALFGVSAAYHLLASSPQRRHRLRQADHATIYVFITASYTPFCPVAVPGIGGHIVLSLAWLGALVGAAMKLTRFDRRPIVGAVLYLALGWLLVTLGPGLPVI